MKEKDQKNRRKENLQKVCRRRYNSYFWFSYFHPSFCKEKEMMLPITSKILVQIVKKNSSSLFPNSLLHHIPSLFVKFRVITIVRKLQLLEYNTGEPMSPNDEYPSLSRFPDNFFFQFSWQDEYWYEKYEFLLYKYIL